MTPSAIREQPIPADAAVPGGLLRAVVLALQVGFDLAAAAAVAVFLPPVAGDRRAPGIAPRAAHFRQRRGLVLVALVARCGLRRPRRRFARAALHQRLAVEERVRHLRVRPPAHVDHRLDAAAVGRIVEQLGFAVAARRAGARILMQTLAADIVADGEIEPVAGAHAQRPVLGVVLRPAAVAIALIEAAAQFEALAAETEIEGRRLDVRSARRDEPQPNSFWKKPSALRADRRPSAQRDEAPTTQQQAAKETQRRLTLMLQTGARASPQHGKECLKTSAGSRIKASARPCRRLRGGR